MNTITFLRQFRVADIALFDLTISYVGVYLLSPFLSKRMLKFHLVFTRKHWLWLTLPISIVVHIATKQNTALMKMSFDTHGHYIVKILLIVMTYMGLRGVKKVGNGKD